MVRQLGNFISLVADANVVMMKPLFLKVTCSPKSPVTCLYRYSLF